MKEILSHEREEDQRMKKLYTKPELAYEAFQLDAALAQGCDTRIGHYENQCSITPDDKGIAGPGGTFFNANNCQYDLNGPEVDGAESMCYHGPFFTGGATKNYLVS